MNALLCSAWEALLRAKRTAHEVRQQLDEKEAKIAAIQQELRSTNLAELQAAVALAKAEAKEKAEEWVKVNAGMEDPPCYAEATRLQRDCQEICQQILDAENETTFVQRQLVQLQDERSSLDASAQQHEQQALSLKEKREEIERQKEQCERSLGNLSDLEAELREKQESRDASAQRLAEAQASKAPRDQRAAPVANSAVIHIEPESSSPKQRVLPRQPPMMPEASPSPRPEVPPSPPWAPAASEEEDLDVASETAFPDPPEAPPPESPSPERRLEPRPASRSSRPTSAKSAKSAGSASYDEDFDDDDFEEESDPEDV
ncbi:sdaA [Symbiodinium sp. CCMP2592]|nr:sdaA [Symbiodinium sp. CCMP2592]